MQWNCLRFLGITDFNEIDRMTIPQYELRMKVTQMDNLDDLRDMHYQAYLTFVAQSTETKNDKVYPKYPKFEDFFDYEKQKSEILNQSKATIVKDTKLNHLIQLANAKGGN